MFRCAETKPTGWALVVLVWLFCSATALAGQLKDPTRPPSLQKASPVRTVVKKRIPSLTLSAVLVSPGRKLAVINGQTLRVGQNIDGFRLVEIDSSRVLLRKGSREVDLALAHTTVKKTSPRAEEGSK